MDFNWNRPGLSGALYRAGNIIVTFGLPIGLLSWFMNRGYYASRVSSPEGLRLLAAELALPLGMLALVALLAAVFGREGALKWTKRPDDAPPPPAPEG